MLRHSWTLNITNTSILSFSLTRIIAGEVTANEEESHPQQFKKLILFSGSDYLGLSSHPTIKRAASKVCLMIFLLKKTFVRHS